MTSIHSQCPSELDRSVHRYVVALFYVNWYESLKFLRQLLFMISVPFLGKKHLL